MNKKIIKFVSEVPEEKEDNDVIAKTEFIKTFINMKTYKFITFDDLLTFSTTKFTTDKSDIIIKYIHHLVSIVNETFYIYSDDCKIHYRLPPQMIGDDFLKAFIITFIETSIKKLSHSDQNKLGKNINLGVDILKTIKTNLRVDEKLFSNPKLGEIHFKNGYLDLKTLEFRQRKRTDYMTYCIWRDFKLSSPKSKETIHKIHNQIYPNENDKNCVLESFGEGISGYSHKSQYSLFLLGIGQTGKSTIMKMSKIAFKEMVFQFKEDSFALGNQKSDRILNMLMYNPFIRIMWVNELKGKIDDSLFKQVVEGLVNTTTLFKEGQNTVKFNALLINTMNEFPNIKIDSGIVRRIKSLEHKSKFTYNKEDVDEKNHIYYANTDLEEMFEQDEDLQNAFVEIIAEYAHEFLNGRRFPLSENFKETKSNIIDTNDMVKEFMECQLTRTKDEKDKIHLDEMYDSFKIVYPQSKITKQQLFGQLKDKGLIYNSNVRSPVDTNKRGCFICVKYNQQKVASPLDNAINYEFGKTAEYEALKDENSKLKKEIEDLKKQIESLTKPVETVKPVEIPKSKKTFTLEELESSSNKTDVIRLTGKPVKKNKAKNNPQIVDIDDGYTSEELEKQFSSVIGKLKKV